MAQRISKEEFEKQSAEFTKKSLAELNEQLKNFHPKKVFHDEEKDAEEDFFDSDESEYSPHKNKRRIIIETNVKNKKKRANKNDIDTNCHLITSQERKLKDVKAQLKSEENKSHFLTLDLSNARCDLETTKAKLDTTTKNFSNILRVRLFLMLYLLFLNVFILAIWVSLPLYDKLIFTPFTTASFYSALFFKRHFYNLQKL
jgi:hypothetical protein